ncbi:MAG: Mobile element protein, partial [uncultured Rubrobacteraceae bacterium]
GGFGRRASQSGHPGVLRAVGGRGQAEEGGAGGLHAQAAYHPQCGTQTPHPLEALSYKATELAIEQL